MSSVANSVTNAAIIKAMWSKSIVISLGVGLTVQPGAKKAHQTFVRLGLEQNLRWWNTAYCASNAAVLMAASG